MNKVEIYTSTNCMHCHNAKEFFTNNNIDFVEHNISKDIEAKRTLMSKGYRAVPLIVIDGEEMLGFDEEKVKSKL